MVFVFLYLQTNLFETIQLIQNNNACLKIVREGTAQLMSNILVHLPVNYSQQVVVMWNYTYSSH